MLVTYVREHRGMSVEASMILEPQACCFTAPRVKAVPQMSVVVWLSYSAGAPDVVGKELAEELDLFAVVHANMS